VDKLKKCSISNCNRKHKAKEFCSLHYVRWKKHGDPNKVLPQIKNKVPIEKRFWKYIVKDKNPDKCWKWTGSKISFGYGMLRHNHTGILAHRISYELLVGPIHAGLFVCHLCDNPECCNPKHLWLGTNKDNTNDRDKKGRCKSNVGINNPRATLSENQMIIIKYKLKEGISLSKLAKEFSITKTSMWRIKNGISWKHIVI
jgi:hypothetical protein